MTITMGLFLEACAGFTCVCVAIGWLAKVFKLVKKPMDDVDAKFAYYDECLRRDKKKLDRLDGIAESNTECLKLLLESVFIMLGHMETNNEYGKMKAQREKLQSYLTEQI